MIAYLQGRLVHRGLESVVLDVNGVGYKVAVPTTTLQSLPPLDSEATLHIHTHVREDALRLFGFSSKEALDLFERLITVSGVGPKLALAGLSQFSPSGLQRAIVTADVSALKSISGVGKRTAERMIVDLGPSVGKLDLSGDGSTPAVPAGGALTGQLEEALRYLGYKPTEIKRVVQKLMPTAPPDARVEELLRQALQLVK